MTITYPITVVPGVTAPAGSPNFAAALAAATRALPIGGRPKTLVDRMTASLSDYLEDVIGRSLLTLIDTGILAKLDRLSIVGANAADSLLDWQGGAATTNVSSMPWVSGVGMKPAAAGPYLELPLTLGQFQVGNASAFAYATVEDMTGNTPLLGYGPNTDTLYIYPAQTSRTTASCRLNCEITKSAGYTGSRIGLWCATEVAGNVGLWRNGVQIVAPTATTISTPTPIMRLNAKNTSRAVWGLGAWGYGAALTPAEQATLAGVIEGMLATVGAV